MKWMVSHENGMSLTFVASWSKFILTCDYHLLWSLRFTSRSWVVSLDFIAFVDSLDYSIEYFAWVALIALVGASSFNLFALIALRYLLAAALITSYFLSR